MIPHPDLPPGFNELPAPEQARQLHKLVETIEDAKLRLRCRYALSVALAPEGHRIPVTRGSKQHSAIRSVLDCHVPHSEHWEMCLEQVLDQSLDPD